MSLSVFGKSIIRDDKGKALGVGLSADEKLALPMTLSRDLGVLLQQNRDARTLKAITDPSGLLTDRQTAMTELVEGIAQGTWIKTYERLFKEGVPANVCSSYATEQSKRAYEDEVKVLELLQPGMFERSYGLAPEAVNYKQAAIALDQPQLAAPVGQDIEAIERNAIARYKRHKKAKRTQK